MDDVASVQLENENLRKIRSRLLLWDAKNNALAALNVTQEECLEQINSIWSQEAEMPSTEQAGEEVKGTTSDLETNSLSLSSLQQSLPPGIDTTHDFLMLYDQVHAEIHENSNAVSHRYLQQLITRSTECKRILTQIEAAMGRLKTLREEYAFVSEKTEALNNASEKLIEEQEKLQSLGDEIHKRLHYFNQVELLNQRLHSPTLSVASESFRECLTKIDECLTYLKEHSKFKDSPAFIIKYKHCLAKAVTLVKNYVNTVMSQATEATLHPKQINTLSGSSSSGATDASITSPDAAFALYYGKYQTSAAKVKRVSQMIESRINVCPEYANLLAELQQNYLNERATIMTPAVDKAIKDIKTQHKGDHCALMRSSCAFLVHICQDEQRLYYQFFALESEQLTSYLENLCNILYDTMRPFIIHINHLETLAEICSILRIEMLEEHVQQNPTALEAFATIANQLLQDVQERLVFRAHLYLQSDILNYNPSAGDLAYPEKLEMMESIALSLQDPPQIRRFDSRSSLVSTTSNVTEADSVDTSVSRVRNMNSPADLHGMWYPTVRRTLVCLSRLYRCVDRPIFQGLSQEALKHCIQSVSAAATKISQSKTPIDGELFEIKHLLILREQIAPFRVDFTVKETSLDFSKVKTAAFGLLQKRKQLFSMGSNNALLEFLLEGTPQIKEHLLDSRKEVDRQLKFVCEKFIKDSLQTLAAPLVTFLEKAQSVVNTVQPAVNKEQQQQQQTQNNKINYALRQSAWASPQQISSVIQETQRLIKSKLPMLQRSMQLYLSNRDTEFIIFRPIRNNIIQSFVKLEQLLTTNGYSPDDMIITSCPSAEQVSIILSSASILAADAMINFSAAQRKASVASVDNSILATNSSEPQRKISLDKKVSFEGSAAKETMENLPELTESSGNNSSVTSPTALSPEPAQNNDMPAGKDINSTAE
ncbi:conserved oligomeric Golgi complex subunit 3 isoform X2 [Lucilia cuprina]|uniref:conserved oligomeric Golgi complex subunit 3 isoform X2 n=1 Tax=Lucilia cuprina TaxID=7375 RepID=UPI001F059920|nr:conserved oligomeric Golgi complex subunit 3 isoform X2 [Lucilia cuprina]